MPKFKNIRVKMKGGKSRLQRVKVLASGKYKFVKNIGRKVKRKSTSRTSRRSKTKKGGTRRMVRRYSRKRRGGGKSGTRGIFKVLRLGSLLAPAAAAAMMSGSGHDKLEAGLSWYTGWSLKQQNFRLSRMKNGWLPFLATCAVTYIAPKINGLIRRL
jgi:hypothetical protein